MVDSVEEFRQVEVHDPDVTLICDIEGLVNGRPATPARAKAAREHESGTVFLAKWNDRRSSWNGLWPTNSRKTERLSRQSGTLLSQTGTLP